MKNNSILCWHNNVVYLNKNIIIAKNRPRNRDEWYEKMWSKKRRRENWRENRWTTPLWRWHRFHTAKENWYFFVLNKLLYCCKRIGLYFCRILFIVCGWSFQFICGRYCTKTVGCVYTTFYTLRSVAYEIKLGDEYGYLYSYSCQ